MKRTKKIRMAIVLIAALAVVLLSISGALAVDTGWKNPSANTADTSGDNNRFEVNPADAYAMAMARATATATTSSNIGGAAASRSYTSLEIEGRFKSRDDVKSLAPGESSTESFRYRWRCTSLDDEIKVCADHVKRIAECNEDNNCWTETWSC